MKHRRVFSCNKKVLEKLKIRIGKRELVDSTEAFKAVIDKKSDALDTTEPTHYAIRQKNDKVLKIRIKKWV